jgi:hypothetical protein
LATIRFACAGKRFGPEIDGESKSETNLREVGRHNILNLCWAQKSERHIL